MTRVFDSSPASAAIAAELRSCDQEPIHVPGAIQPHGCLIAVDRDRRIVAQSDNVPTWIGGGAATLGSSAADFLQGDALEELERFVAGRESRVGQVARMHARSGQVPVHTHTSPDGFFIAEFMAPDGGLSAAQRGAHHECNDSLLALGQSTASESQVAAATVEQVRLTYGFDRVMLYRFLPDDSGEVIAESTDDGKPSWVGLRYPASDIPAPARRLYLRSPVRLIQDAAYVPVRVQQDGERLRGTLDLSDAILRSVSPVHCEYLANMGVRASMSLSIIVGGRLWGLIACHSDRPISLPIDAWPPLRMLARITSRNVQTLDMRADHQGRRHASGVARSLLHRLNETASVESAFLSGAPNTSDLIESDGAVISYRGTRHRVGHAPDADEALITTALADLAADTADRRLLVADTGIGDGWDPGTPGVLAFGFSDDPGDFIAWYRREVTRQVNWAGEPGKAMRVSDNGQLRLHPRKSFERWTETVRGTSAVWEPAAIEAAEALGISLADVIVRVSALEDEIARRKRTESSLLELTHDLEAFAHAASHDLRQPARNVTLRLTMLAQQLGDADEATRRTLERATTGAFQLHRLIDAMNTLAKSSTAEITTEPVDLDELVDRSLEQLGELIRSANTTFERAPLGNVTGSSGLLERLVSNLIENAIKYRDPDRPLRVFIGEAESSRSLPGAPAANFVVRDNGLGIDERDLKRVFKPFGRGKTPEPVEGTGLGLAICRRIAQRHGGDITVRSALGEGSEFRVTLDTPG